MQADAICKAATNRFQEEVASLTGPQLLFETDWERGSRSHLGGGAWGKLRALAPPRGERARVNEIYSLMKRRTGTSSARGGISCQHPAHPHAVGEVVSA